LRITVENIILGRHTVTYLFLFATQFSLEWNQVILHLNGWPGFVDSKSIKARVFLKHVRRLHLDLCDRYAWENAPQRVRVFFSVKYLKRVSEANDLSIFSRANRRGEAKFSSERSERDTKPSEKSCLFHAPWSKKGIACPLVCDNHQHRVLNSLNYFRTSERSERAFFSF
jgi:hypothetical protein